MQIRPNRFQAQIARRILAVAYGEAIAGDILEAAGVARLPETLPSGPRDLAMLTAELRPFSDLYRELTRRSDRATALALMRRIIIASGRVSHGAAHANRAQTLRSGEPLVLTSPPDAGFAAAPEALAEGFRLSMQSFSCEGELLSYSAGLVHFTVTACNWCRAMEQAGTPELIAFFCETDERFMDDHPTHTLVLAETIGRGGRHCDFRFVPRRSGDDEP